MKQFILYSFGYLSAKGERILTELQAVGTPIIDVRYKARSKRWQYGGETLKGRLGDLYHHLPELGNELFVEALNGQWKEPHVKLHDPERGLVLLESILKEKGRAALMCACSQPKECHRRLVAEMARERFGCEVKHL